LQYLAEIRRPLRITWLAPDDGGGGVVSVAQSCCRQAAAAGHDVTLLLALPQVGHAAEFGGLRIDSLKAQPPYSSIPSRLIDWLGHNPQDVLVLNGCEQADVAIPHIPGSTRVVYAVHDTAPRYFNEALRLEAQIDGVFAVSDAVAGRFRERLRNPGKLFVVRNGTYFPTPLGDALAASRANDIIFLGGDNPSKGAFDAVAVWPLLLRHGFAGRLHWFGTIDDRMGARIRALPAADRILVHGRQPRQAIFECAGASKAILMLSRVEPFGMVTVECMGMGCLAVAWDIDTGTREIVSDGEGLLAPLGDYDALARAVMTSLAMHADHHTATAVRIRRDFGEEAMWSRYACAFDRVLEAAPAIRQFAGTAPPPWRRRIRFYQWVPSGLRGAIRRLVGRSPRLGYALRDLRGR